MVAAGLEEGCCCYPGRAAGPRSREVARRKGLVSLTPYGFGFADITARVTNGTKGTRWPGRLLTEPPPGGSLCIGGHGTAHAGITADPVQEQVRLGGRVARPAQLNLRKRATERRTEDYADATEPDDSASRVSSYGADGLGGSSARAVASLL